MGTAGGGGALVGQLGDTMLPGRLANVMLCFRNWLIVSPSIFFFPLEGSGMRAQLWAGTAGQPAWCLPSDWRPRVVDREVCPGTVRKATG